MGKNFFQLPFRFVYTTATSKKRKKKLGNDNERAFTTANGRLDGREREREDKKIICFNQKIISKMEI